MAIAFELKATETSIISITGMLIGTSSTHSNQSVYFHGSIQTLVHKFKTGQKLLGLVTSLLPKCTYVQ